MKKRRENFKIIDEDDDLGSVPVEDEHIKELDSFEDSEEDLPVVVNEEEFLKELNSNIRAESRSNSPSPPRTTVDYQSDDEVVYRDKSGKRITRDQWLLLNQKDKRNKNERVKQELVWGKGLVQKDEEKERIVHEQRVKQQSFQNHDIDEYYDNELKNRRRWEDPINKATGKTRDYVSDKELPKSRFPGVPNRFNIEPGYRWDGVIRGNGYEQRWFQARADRAAKEKEYYLQNIADL
ncbi:hypothetical protein MACJ_001774 [Theileria orientalis]|uniref:Pre-mRNA-splicing factor CWC26 n=1 Tax=Theileria orientalis TaxID=68886 RepID=A0A976QTN7_THEOR|nr:hypothetical protein MACJ_001774 [Theileria orientalis]